MPYVPYIIFKKKSQEKDDISFATAFDSCSMAQILHY